MSSVLAQLENFMGTPPAIYIAYIRVELVLGVYFRELVFDRVTCLCSIRAAFCREFWRSFVPR